MLSSEQVVALDLERHAARQLAGMRKHVMLTGARACE